MLEGTIQSVSVGAVATPALFFRAWILLDLRSCGLTGELGVVVGSGAGLDLETGMHSTSIALEGLGFDAAGGGRVGAAGTGGV